MSPSPETGRAFQELAAAAALLEGLALPAEPVLAEAHLRAWRSTRSPAAVLAGWRREVLGGRGLPRELVLAAREARPA